MTIMQNLVHAALETDYVIPNKMAYETLIKVFNCCNHVLFAKCSMVRIVFIMVLYYTFIGQLETKSGGLLFLYTFDILGVITVTS